MFSGPPGTRTLDLVPCRVLNAIAFKISEANKMSPENSYEQLITGSSAKKNTS